MRGTGLAAGLAVITAGCVRDRGAVAPPEATPPQVVTPVSEPVAPAPVASRPSTPSLPPLSAADRDALAAAGEPTLHETRTPDGVETTLVLRVGEASIPIARAVWEPDACEELSHHFAILDAAHGLVDARINCHFGEDFWTTQVAAELVALELATATPNALWSGAETYTGAMDECTTADGALDYAIEGDTVFQTQASWAAWEPQDPAAPLTSEADCVRGASPDTRTPVAKLQPPRRAP